MDFDIKDYLRQAMAAGISSEDIAKGFSDALNEVENEKTPREQVIEDLKNELWDCPEAKFYTHHNAAIIAALAGATEHPDWSAEDIKDFIKCEEDSLEIVTKYYKNIDKIFSNLWL
jgi:uncharacterized protein (DUF433 family)